MKLLRKILVLKIIFPALGLFWCLTLIFPLSELALGAMEVENTTDATRPLSNRFHGNALEDPDEALRVAVRKENVQLVDTLLKSGANPNYPFDDNDNAVDTYLVFIAPWEGDLSILKLLLNSGADVNVTRTETHGDSHLGWEGGVTPLHDAARQGNEKVAALLLEHDANVHAESFYNEIERGKITPLHDAAKRGFESIVKLLLEHGANPNAENLDGETPLHLAQDRGYEKVAELLLENNGDINALREGGQTLLHILAGKGVLSPGQMWPLPLAGEEKDQVLGYLKFLDLMIDDLPTTERNQITSRIKKASSALERGVNINAQDNLGFTALHLAAIMNDGEFLNFLLDQGSDIDIPSRKKGTPLHYAAQFGRLEVTKILVDRGANVNLKTLFGLTPMALAVKYDRQPIVKYFEKENVSANASTKNIPNQENSWDNLSLLGFNLKMQESTVKKSFPGIECFSPVLFPEMTNPLVPCRKTQEPFKASIWLCTTENRKEVCQVNIFGSDYGSSKIDDAEWEKLLTESKKQNGPPSKEYELEGIAIVYWGLVKIDEEKSKESLEPQFTCAGPCLVLSWRSKYKIIHGFLYAKQFAEGQQTLSSARPKEESIRKQKTNDSNSRTEKKIQGGQASSDYENIQLVNSIAPEYPRIARENGWEGTVVLRLSIHSDGKPKKVIIEKSSGHSILDNSAIKAIQSWEFKAARKGGIPIKKELMLPMKFDLRK